MYQVISQGLTNPDPTAMLTVFGHQVVDVQCVNGLGTPAYDPYQPCIDTIVPWLGGMDVSKPQVLFTLPLIGGFSLLALISAFLQLVQSRMTMPPSDPAYQDQNSRVQRQLVLFLPLISILYGGFLPAGLFIYWIVTTIFWIAQQYLIVGWGSMFPLLGWTPGFAKDHTPEIPRRATIAQEPDTGRREGGPDIPITPQCAHGGRPHQVRGVHRAPARTRPPGPPREKALTS